MDTSQSLPEYASELEAYHRAHAEELRRIIDNLPLEPGQKVLDLACGDGAYTAWLAERVGPRGLVVGADLSHGFLQVARDEQPTHRTELIAARAERLPFAEGSFNLAWCAQSLASLPNPLTALREMRRVVKPRGYIAVLENDSFHQTVLPWPEELELAVRQAEFLAHRIRSRGPSKYYIARRLRRLFQSAGLIAVRRKTYCTDRAAPLDDVEEDLLRRHLKRLGELVAPLLVKDYRRQFAQAIDPDSPSYLPSQEGFEMTWLDVVCIGQKPLPKPRRARRSFAKTAPLARRSLHS